MDTSTHWKPLKGIFKSASKAVTPFHLPDVQGTLPCCWATYQKNSQYPLKNVHNQKVKNNVLLGALLRT